MSNLQWHMLEPILQWLGLISLFTFLLSLAVIPWLISRLPSDYFIRHTYAASARNIDLRFRTPFWLVIRNLIGSVLFFAGIAMLFLPGQGILTIVVGISLLTFPGKHHFLSFLTDRVTVQKALDWIRTKTGRQTFIWPKNRTHQHPSTKTLT